MKGYDALECTLISRSCAGKHLGNLSELSWFLFEFHADDYKSLGLPAIPPFASSGTIHIENKPSMYKKNIKILLFCFYCV